MLRGRHGLARLARELDSITCAISVASFLERDYLILIAELAQDSEIRVVALPESSHTDEISSRVLAVVGESAPGPFLLGV